MLAGLRRLSRIGSSLEADADVKRFDDPKIELVSQLPMVGIVENEVPVSTSATSGKSKDNTPSTSIKLKVVTRRALYVSSTFNLNER
jgi:hypothetical protein